ncbi:MAG: sigma-70 family RNA polymerase sigma factor [Armatimonadota bacterium]
MNRCIERARDGDLPAVQALIEILRPRIAKMAAYYARYCGEDPDDLIQEGWVGLLEALPLLDISIGTPEQYLIKHARWRILDAIKRARILRCSPLDDSMADSPAYPYADIAFGDALVSEFAMHLSTTQRAIINCLVDGLTWREAGDALGCTSANIAYHIRQIRKQYEEWNADLLPITQTKNLHTHKKHLANAACRTI